MGEVIWSNGRFRPNSSLSIRSDHPLALHGVGVFETLRLVAGRAPLLERHLARAAASCDELGIAAPRPDWQRILAELSRRNRMRNGVARITWSQDLCFASLRALPRDPKTGVVLPVRSLVRSLPHIKTTSRLDLWQAEQLAGGEVALVGRGGQLLETSRANLFAVTDAGIMTARANRVLPGIGRQLVLEFARTHKIPVRAQAPRLRDWKHWRACFASNAVRGIRPVSQLGEIDLPDAREDSTVKALQEHYAEAIRS